MPREKIRLECIPWDFTVRKWNPIWELGWCCYMYLRCYSWNDCQACDKYDVSTARCCSVVHSSGCLFKRDISVAIRWLKILLVLHLFHPLASTRVSNQGEKTRGRHYKAKPVSIHQWTSYVSVGEDPAIEWKAGQITCLQFGGASLSATITVWKPSCSHVKTTIDYWNVFKCQRCGNCVIGCSQN